ncbi:hypothetical protein ACWEN6_13500 [Sphaerisporangium sp. NPDC004334]
MTTSLYPPLAVTVTPTGRIIMTPTAAATVWPPELELDFAAQLAADLDDAVRRGRQIRAEREQVAQVRH